VRLFSAGDIPEVVAIALFALYASLLPETHRNVFILIGAAVLAAFLTWRSNEKTKRRNDEAWKRLKTEIEKLEVDESLKMELLRTIDDLYSEARRKGFAVKVIRLGNSRLSDTAKER